MGTVVMSHVDKLSGALHALECSLDDSLRTADECNHSTVGGLARIDIQNLYSARFPDGAYYRIDDFHIASFAEIRNALDDSFHMVYLVFTIVSETIYKVRDFKQINKTWL